MVGGLLSRDEVKTIGVGTAQESRRYQSRSVVANPVQLRGRSGAPDARPAETGAGHGPVPANSLQGYSGRRRRDAPVLDADTLQDPIVAAGRTWKLIPLTFHLCAPNDLFRDTFQNFCACLLNHRQKLAWCRRGHVGKTGHRNSVSATDGDRAAHIHGNAIRGLTQPVKVTSPFDWRTMTLAAKTSNCRIGCPGVFGETI